MILTTTEQISGRELETLGLVRGSTIQSKNIGKDITQGFKTLVGGENRGRECRKRGEPLLRQAQRTALGGPLFLHMHPQRS